MTSSDMPHSKFLSKPEELGVVAVGFSGGQVCLFDNLHMQNIQHLSSLAHITPTKHSKQHIMYMYMYSDTIYYSANQESTQHHQPSSKAAY